MDRIFFHGTGDDYYSLERMLKIIESGGIKSLNKRGVKDIGLFNGRNYISVCSWDDDISHDITDNKSAFNGWIFNCPCFIIEGIDAIKCEPYHLNYDSESERVSQFEDEWHVKDYIPLDKIIGIGLPLTNERFISQNKEVLDKIMEYAGNYNWIILESDESLIENINNLKRRRGKC